MASSSSSSPSFLELCLLPTLTSKEEFFKDYFLKKPLHSRMPNRFDRHFRLADLEFLWSNTMKLDPSSMLFFHKASHPGGPIPNLRSAFFAFAHQISVVVNKADRLSPAILNICRSFEEQFPFVFCNVYSTPAGEQTVPLHVDDRDVFILQVHGTKHWTIYEDVPVVLPYKSEELGKNQPNSPKSYDEKNAKIAFAGPVECGDVVYLPRGFPHVAKADPSSPSVHLTIAIQTSDWDIQSVLQDGFEGALSELLRNSAVAGNVEESKRPEEFTLRQVLPPSILSSESTSPSSSSSASSLLLKSTENTFFNSKLESSISMVFKKLSDSPHLCVDYFKNRLAQKRQSRIQYFEENVAPIAFFPLSHGSLVQWVNRVQIVQISPMTKNNNNNNSIGNISHLVILTKKSQQEMMIMNSNQEKNSSGGTMQLSVSDAVLDVMLMWEKHFSECPAQVAQIANILERSNNNTHHHHDQKKGSVVDYSLAAICTAGFLLRNGCLIRVN